MIQHRYIYLIKGLTALAYVNVSVSVSVSVVHLVGYYACMYEVYLTLRVKL